MIADATFLHFIITTQPDKDAIIELAKNNCPGVIISDGFSSFWAACFINLIKIFAKFTWNYVDVFIMVVSVGLSTHFKLINDELEQAVLYAEPDNVYPHLSGVHPILEVSQIFSIVMQ